MACSKSGKFIATGEHIAKSGALAALIVWDF